MRFPVNLSHQFWSLSQVASEFLCIYLHGPESDVYQKDVGYLSECILNYLRDLPSPLIPTCIYSHLQAALTMQQQVLQQSAGTSHVMTPILQCKKGCHLNFISLTHVIDSVRHVAEAYHCIFHIKALRRCETSSSGWTFFSHICYIFD